MPANLLPAWWARRLLLLLLLAGCRGVMAGGAQAKEYLSCHH
jgi:hypothetical protein